MNATFTRRMFAVTGLAAIGGALYSLLPFTRRSKSSPPEITHLLDEQNATTGSGHSDITTGSKVLSSQQEEVRDWYRKEFGVEPVYSEDGTIDKFIAYDPITTEPKEYDREYVRDIVEELSQSGDIEHLPIPDGVEGHGEPTTPLWVGAPTEAVEKSLH